MHTSDLDRLMALLKSHQPLHKMPIPMSLCLEMRGRKNNTKEARGDIRSWFSRFKVKCNGLKKGSKVVAIWR